MEFFEMPDFTPLFYPQEKSDEQLKEEMYALREEMADALTETIWLYYHIVPQYLMKYADAYGQEELELLQLRSQEAYTERLITCIQEKQQNKAPIYLDTLTKEVQQEPDFQAAQNQINEYKIRLFNAKLYHNNPDTTPEQDAEMKETVRTLLLILHPYLNADYDENKRELLERVSKACNRNQLEELWHIEQEIEALHIVPMEQKEYSRELMLDNIKMYQEKLEEPKNLNARIYADFPLSQQDILNDPAKIQAHLDALEQHLEVSQHHLYQLEQTMKQLLESE
ncbi:hypothetical protein [Ruminococcus sp.]|uniref:hypothetical protein n=1 Tax=Ruminococcus sp. TaxID=41978 RepID=UPI0025E0805A|nr:hypothetical protein [Ruminococcus sp.]